MRDTQHHCPFSPENIWNGDSVQVAIDPEMNGDWVYDPKDVELGVALGDSGVAKHVFHGRAAGCRAWVSCRGGSVTSYEIMVPWSDLGLEGRDGTEFAFNMLANDSDGAGRAAWVDLTPGIGEIKAPVFYKKLRLVR